MFSPKRAFDLTLGAVIAELGRSMAVDFTLMDSHDYRITTDFWVESGQDPRPIPFIDIDFNGSTIVSRVPEPGNLVLLGIGLFGLGLLRKR